MLRCVEGYSSHLSVLERLDDECGIGNAIEFGVGEHSTPWLVEHATSLHSVETNRDWYLWAEDRYGDLPNFKLSETRPRSLSGFDLILIDDGENATARIETLTWALSRSRRRGTIVLHDANVAEYQAVLRGFGVESQMYRDETPWTAVIAP